MAITIFNLTRYYGMNRSPPTASEQQNTGIRLVIRVFGDELRHRIGVDPALKHALKGVARKIYVLAIHCCHVLVGHAVILSINERSATRRDCHMRFG